MTVAVAESVTDDESTPWWRSVDRIAVAAVIVAIAIYVVTFSYLCLRNYRNYGNWAYDLAIYDQAFWLVSRFDQTFMTVRGLDVWGHHLNLIAFAFAPLYWLGWTPQALFIVQSFALGVAAWPVFLIARKRFGRADVGVLFAFGYLLYPAMNNVNWRDFHPEALVVAPFMFAWYCALVGRWRWFGVLLLLTVAMREDAALAVIMLGVVLVIANRREGLASPKVRAGAIAAAAAAIWYVVATKLVLPHFNDGDGAFYLKFFYGRYGGSFRGIIEAILFDPERVVSDAVQPDRIDFYKGLFLPYGGLSLLAPVHLLMAAPQLLASVIGDQPAARVILYQYTAVMIAPITIAAIEGARKLWSVGPAMRRGVVIVFALSVYISNNAWSMSPLGAGFEANWARDNDYSAVLDEAVAQVPDDASVAATYNLVPHLAHRELIFDWPNPFVTSYWGKATPAEPNCDGFPSPAVIDFLVLDMRFVGSLTDESGAARLVAAMTGPGGDFEVIWEEEFPDHRVLVAERIKPGPDGEPLPVNCSVDPAAPATFETLIAHYPVVEDSAPDDSTGNQPLPPSVPAPTTIPPSDSTAIG